MRRKALVYCEVCGDTKPSGTPEFFMFHCLAFCSPDCLEDYKAADEERRARNEAAASSAQSSTRRRSRAA